MITKLTTTRSSTFNGSKCASIESRAPCLFFFALLLSLSVATQSISVYIYSQWSEVVLDENKYKTYMINPMKIVKWGKQNRQFFVFVLRLFVCIQIKQRK